MLYQRLSRLPNYVKAFGAWEGLRFCWAIERALPQVAETRRAFRVPGFAGPVWLRDCVSDHAIFWQCMVRAQYRTAHLPHHRRLWARYEALLAAGVTPLIIDAGGNIGLSAIWFAEAYPRARVLAVEPDRANFEVLQANVAAYGGRIHAVLGAVWHREQALDIVNPEAGASALRVEAGGAGGAVQAHTVQGLMAMAGAEEALIVKLDIEGAQKALFSENTGWIAAADVVMLELDDWQFPWEGSSRPFFRAMAGYEFEYLMNGENMVCFNARLAP